MHAAAINSSLRQRPVGRHREPRVRRELCICGEGPSGSPAVAPPPSALPSQKQGGPSHSSQGPALPWIQSASPTWSQSVAPPGDSPQPGANPAPPRHRPLPLLPPPQQLLPLQPPPPAAHAALPGVPAARGLVGWLVGSAANNLQRELGQGGVLLRLWNPGKPGP